MAPVVIEGSQVQFLSSFRVNHNHIAMEQQFINLLTKLLDKTGAGPLIRDLVSAVEENGDPKNWSAVELDKAIPYINWQIENFGTAEASAVIETLLKKYNLQVGNFHKNEEALPESTGVPGLQ